MKSRGKSQRRQSEEKVREEKKKKIKEEKVRRKQIKEEKVRRKMMQVREKVGKTRNTVFFQWCVAPERRVWSHLPR